MKTGVVPALVVTHPLTVRMHVGGFGMTFGIFIIARRFRAMLGGRGLLRLTRRWGRSARRSIAATYMLLSASVFSFMLRIDARRANQQDS
jgi:hypothetical protein